jgi:hypothetical protein
MHEFWLKDKLILLIGLFQFGLVLIVMTVVNLIKLTWKKQNIIQNIVDTNSPNEIRPAAIAFSNFSEARSDEIINQLPNELPNELKDAVSNPLNPETSHKPPLVNSNDSDRLDTPEQDQLEVNALEHDLNYDLDDDLNYKVDIAPELLTELKEISDNPAAVIDEAIRWWLRRRTFDVLDASDDRPDRMGMRPNKSKRSTKDLWND